MFAFAAPWIYPVSYTHLAGSFVTVQDKDVLDASTDDDLLWGAQPYGMYYLTDYVPGSHVELARNPYYITHNPNVSNKGAAQVEKVTVRFISEELSMANACLLYTSSCV